MLEARGDAGLRRREADQAPGRRGFEARSRVRESNTGGVDAAFWLSEGRSQMKRKRPGRAQCWQRELQPQSEATSALRTWGGITRGHPEWTLMAAGRRSGPREETVRVTSWPSLVTCIQTMSADPGMDARLSLLVLVSQLSHTNQSFQSHEEGIQTEKWASRRNKTRRLRKSTST